MRVSFGEMIFFATANLRVFFAFPIIIFVLLFVVGMYLCCVQWLPWFTFIASQVLHESTSKE